MDGRIQADRAVKQEFALSRLIRFFAPILALSLAAPALLGPHAQAAEYALAPSPTTIQFGYFTGKGKPVLTINSGDIVDLTTATQIDPADVDASGVVPPSAVPQYVRDVFREVKDRGPGPHILTGPIYVNGAEPGDVLEVRLLKIDPATDYGYNVMVPKGGLLPEDFTTRWQRVIRIDRAKREAYPAPGVVVPLHPFFGTIGVAPPPEMGRVSSGPPGMFGGNMDNKDLGEGATIYFPVFAKGALFTAGDSHGAQGDGEIDVAAIETDLHAKIQFILHKNMKLALPQAENSTHWIIMGLAPTLDEAIKAAARGTIDFITQRYPKISREEAYMISSIAVDFHVTQVVDRTVGVHAMIPKAIFASYPDAGK
jgi:acetamidase/formamidase